MFKLKSRSHQADSFFVMLLFFLFALTAFILVLIGVKQYKSTANAMNYNYEVRTVTSYLREKVSGANSIKGGGRHSFAQSGLFLPYVQKMHGSYISRVCQSGKNQSHT
jgi:hypothetical protein